MLKKSRIFILILLTVFLSIGFFNCSKADESAGEKKDDFSTLKERFVEKKVIVMGTSADYPPFEFYLVEGDEKSELVGLDIDIAKEIAKSIGVELKIKTFPFHQLFNILNEGQADFVIAGINPSEKRRELVDFSDIYFKAVQNILIRKIDAEKIKGIEDLRGSRVGVQKGTVQADLVEQSITGAQFLKDDSIINLMKSLKSGEIDALVVEKPVADAFIARNNELISLTCEANAWDKELGVAIAVKKKDKGLLKFINKVLSDLAAANKIKDFIENANILNTRSLETEEPIAELTE